MKLLLRILSWFYGIGVWLNNLLYDEHLRVVRKPSVPTICVGNLAVGGTGKTPHTEYVVDLLRRSGYQVAVLSRGYKRRSKGFILADDHATAATIGDEPRQLQLRFSDVKVAVCESRGRGLRLLKRHCPEVDIVVLDDAFQHRKIRCGLNILLTPADNLYVHDHLLPYGRLREQSQGAVRADMIVVTKCPTTLQPIDRRVILNELKPAAFQELTFSHMVYADDLPQRFFLFAGIAQPQYLLQDMGDRVIEALTFPDHHHYTVDDMATIARSFQGDAPILTTEKDYVKLLDADMLSEDLKERVRPIRIHVDFGTDADTFNRRILLYAKEHCKK